MTSTPVWMACRALAIALLLFLDPISVPQVVAQTGGETGAVRLNLSTLQAHSVTVRFNLRTYRNDRYAGLLYREVRARLRPAASGPQAVDARYFVLEETIRDTSRSARLVDRSYNTTLQARTDGTLVPQSESPFPRRRNFPASPIEPVLEGDTWEEPATLIIDPLWRGVYHEVRTTAGYEYAGTDRYQGREVHVIRARYGFRSDLGSGTRYESGAGGSAGNGVSSGSAAGRNAPVTHQFSSPPTRVQGSHTTDILIDRETGAPLLMRDRIEERYAFRDGDTLRFDGFALTFFDELTPIDRPRVAQELRESLGIASVPDDGPGTDPGSSGPGGSDLGSGTGPGSGPGAGTGPDITSGRSPSTPPGTPEGPAASNGASPEIDDAMSGLDSSGVENIEVEPAEEGIRVRLKELRFQPDRAVLLPAERARLDAVANALAGTAPRPLLVAGHTADIGNPTGQQQLSVERAKAIVDALTQRGIDADRLIYEGRGAREPVAPNDTEAGRARNRRVEIYVLD